MTNRERKRILYFLETLLVNLESHEDNHVNTKFLKLFSRKELIDMILWLHTNHDSSMLARKTDSELLELLNDDANVLAYVIEQWKTRINAVPQLNQEEVHYFFDELQIDPHYLRDKPIELWDDYDVSNYYSILLKRGKTKRVFAIFTSDVKNEDKYAVTTQPSFFFDTKEEAEEELKRICVERNQSKSDFVIHSLWKIN